MASAQIAKTESRQYNLFPLQIPAGAKLKYRIWTIDPIPTTPKLREKIRSYLWRTAMKRPVFPQQDKTFAVAEWDSSKSETIEYVGDGEKRYTISPTTVYGELELAKINSEQADFAVAMLQQQLDLYLRKKPDLVRGYVNSQYFINTPDNPYNPNHQARQRQSEATHKQEVDIFRGFTFRVVFFRDFGVCIAIDAISSYVGHFTLAEYKSRNENPKHVEMDDGLSRWVNDYGSQKQSVYLLGVSGRTIGDTILKDGQSVFEYLIGKYPQLNKKLSRSDLAATVIYKLEDRYKEEKHYSVAATLLKPKFNTASSGVRSLGDTPAFPPFERVKRIEKFRKYFFGVTVNDKSIFIKSAAQSERFVFEMPKLLFSDHKVLSFAETENSQVMDARKEWGDRKLEYLQEYGPLEKKDFTNPFFVYPVSLEEGGLLERFLEKVKVYCEKYGSCNFKPELSSYQDDAHPKKIIDKLKGIEKHQRAGFILLALPDNPIHASQVYTGIKTQIPVPSKCFSSFKLRQKASKDLSTYATLNSLGMLVENGARLWGLAAPLYYEAHFGFDVARTKDNSLMGASVITDATYSNIQFVHKVLSKRDSNIRREGIPTKIIGSYILKCLEQFFAKNQRLPKNILFQRDGRFFEDELNGIERALQKLVQNHPEQSFPSWSAVAIQKNPSIKLRMFDKLNSEKIDRPFSGSYVLQSKNVGHLITAGAPTLRHGTPKPMQVELMSDETNNSENIEDVLKDIFYLSQLNWNAPEIDISLPVTLRFTDQKLERYALELEDESEDEEWDIQEDELGDE